MSKTLRIIKKYPNRRLYDTEVSQYITLGEIKQLILDHIPFKVVEVRTKEDMTNYVLLQIINEEELGSAPLFTTEILLNFIRFYGNPLQAGLSQMLAKTLNFFAENQKNNPLENFAELTKRNMEFMQKFWDPNFYKTK